MLICAILALVWFLSRQNNLLSHVKGTVQDSNLENVAENYHYRFVDNEFNQSFAGRTQLNVRNPFGPNPQDKNIIDKNFVNDHKYQREYQTNLAQMYIQNQDWRLDDQMNGSPVGNYVMHHQSLDNLKKMENFDAPAMEINSFFKDCNNYF